MKILSSDLSMDATTGHRDVTTLALSGGRRNERSSEDGFTLNLPDRFSEQSTFQYNSRFSAIEAKSFVTDKNKQLCHAESHSQFVEQLVGRLTGKEVRINSEQEDTEKPWLWQDQPNRPTKRFYRVGGEPFQVTLGVNTTRVEQEFLNFSSTGSVKTEDGREIDFSLDFSMETASISSQTISSGLFIDPIVFNFEGGLDMLSERFDFSFDMDCDGEDEQICSLNKGNGFLALDLNGDQNINNGSELFGPSTGNGYGELAAYDEDGNFWIDENDSIFDDLKIWMNAGTEDASLITLREAGVGAISLSHTNSNHFSLKAGDGTVLGQVNSSGVFLMEDGEVRSMQELDFAVEGEETGNRLEEQEGMSFMADNSLFQTLQERLIAHRERMIEDLQRQRADKIDRLEQESLLQKRYWKWQEDVEV